MATTLKDIKFFFNHKKYPFSMVFQGRKMYAEAGQAFVKRDGSYFIHETLLGLAKKGLVSYEMKTVVDKLLKNDDSSEDLSEDSNASEVLYPYSDEAEENKSSEEELVPKRKIIHKKT